jgi:hypothetical protein
VNRYKYYNKVISYNINIIILIFTIILYKLINRILNIRYTLILFLIRNIALISLFLKLLVITLIDLFIIPLIYNILLVKNITLPLILYIIVKRKFILYLKTFKLKGLLNSLLFLKSFILKTIISFISRIALSIKLFRTLTLSLKE